jgi:hypothetical protein
VAAAGYLSRTGDHDGHGRVGGPSDLHVESASNR